jgi:hypothetical protein
LIDAETNATAGAGMIREVLHGESDALNTAPVTAHERAARWGHRGAVLRLKAPAAVAYALERALLEAGAFVVRPPDDDPTTPGILADAGALVLAVEEDEDMVSLRIGNSQVEFVSGSDPNNSVAVLLDLLQRAKVLDRKPNREHTR